jgi:hypothetical protein
MGLGPEQEVLSMRLPQAQILEGKKVLSQCHGQEWVFALPALEVLLRPQGSKGS